MTEPFTARQSQLHSVTQCPRREWHAIQAGWDAIRGNVGDSGVLGTLMHAVAAEILRTLRAQDMTEMPQQEAIEIAYAIYAASPIVLPADEADDLIDLTVKFVTKREEGPDGKPLPRTWRVDRLMTTPHGELAIEQRLDVPIVCQDGVTRVLSCQPDALFAGGPGTLVIPDYKSGKGTPKTPKQPQDDVPRDVAVGKRYLSDRGHFQGDSYSLAALHNYPGAKRALFRELHLPSGQIREAIFTREDMIHVSRQLGIVLMHLERGLTEPDSEWGQKFWQPKPGAHCARQCPVARSCPIPAEQRGVGALETDEMADAEARRFVVVDALRDEMLAALKTRYTQTGYAARIGDGRCIAWNGGKGGARQIVEVNDGAAGVVEARNGRQ